MMIIVDVGITDLSDFEPLLPKKLVQIPLMIPQILVVPARFRVQSNLVVELMVSVMLLELSVRLRIADSAALAEHVRMSMNDCALMYVSIFFATSYPFEQTPV
jgi:hypothetical protein